MVPSQIIGVVSTYQKTEKERERERERERKSLDCPKNLNMLNVTMLRETIAEISKGKKGGKLALQSVEEILIIFLK